MGNIGGTLSKMRSCKFMGFVGFALFAFLSLWSLWSLDSLLSVGFVGFVGFFGFDFELNDNLKDMFCNTKKVFVCYV